VGVVADVHRSQISEQPAMQFYLPYGQERDIGGTYILVRPAGPVNTMVTPIRRLIAAEVPKAPFVSVRLLEDYVAPQYRSFELGAAIFSACGLLALLVAGVGLYSVMSYLVAQRRHEFGVRIALGARGVDLLRLVLTGGIAVTAGGVALGAGIAFAAGRFLQPLLFETRAHDARVYAVVAASLILAAALAALGPALRARHVNPLDALRAE